MPRGIMPRQPAKTRQQDKVPAALTRTKLTGKTPAKNPAKTPKSAKALNFRSIRPPRGYNPTAPERISQILAGLDAMYPSATCALTHTSAWELLVATILSAQCTDARVNMVTPIIFRKYPTPQHFAALQPEELEPDIQSTGFFRNKSKSVVGAARKLVEDFGGKVPDEMEKLLTLPGVARKTANVVLGTWFHKAVGVVVDTHVHRISRRLELTKEKDAPRIEQDLIQAIPRERWIDFSHMIIHHGRALCVARKPKCAQCKLEIICHAADKTWSTVEIHNAAQP